jgi:hypothetical protein
MAKWAYSFPFGLVALGVLDECTDEELQRWPIGRLRDQAVSVDMDPQEGTCDRTSFAPSD